MAVVDTYVDANLLASASGLPELVRNLCAGDGTGLVAMVQTFEIPAGDDNASVYRVFKDVPSNFIPLMIMVACDDLGTATSAFDLGLYDSAERGGAAVDDDCFAASLSFDTAVASLNPKTALDGMAAVDIANVKRRLWEYDSSSYNTVRTRKPSYDIAFTADTNTNSAGTVSILIIGVKG